jgi:hypothetical protein
MTLPEEFDFRPIALEPALLRAVAQRSSNAFMIFPNNRLELYQNAQLASRMPSHVRNNVENLIASIVVFT